MYVRLGTQPVTTVNSNGKRMTNFFAMRISPESETSPASKWFRVIAWNNLSDIASKHLSKGKNVVLSGNLIQRTFKTRKGETRIKEYILASNLILTDSGSVSPQHSNAA